MGTWYHLTGTYLDKCVEKCGARPTASNYGGGIMSADFSRDIAKWNSCRNMCQSQPDVRQSTPTFTSPANTSSTSDSPLTIGYKEGHEPQVGASDSATTTGSTGTSTNVKIGIGVGILVVGFIGYKLLTKKKAA